MYEFAGSKSAKLVVREYGKLVARILQSFALLACVSTLINPHTYFAGFAVFYISTFSQYTDYLPHRGFKLMSYRSGVRGSN
jgi:hypothetical protein